MSIPEPDAELDAIAERLVNALYAEPLRHATQAQVAERLLAVARALADDLLATDPDHLAAASAVAALLRRP